MNYPRVPNVVGWVKSHLTPRAALDPFWTSILAGSTLISAGSRGLDYIAIDTCEDTVTGRVARAINDCAPASLSVVERALPMDAWGGLMVFAVLLTFLTWAVGYWPGVIMGHITLVGVYVTLGLGSLWAILGDEWNGSGWRTGVAYIAGAAAVHFVLARSALREWDRTRVKT